MQIEYAILRSIIPLALSLLTFSRTQKKDAASDASQMTTVIVKLESIQQGIGELKNDVGSMKQELKDMDHRLTIAEQSLKAAWKQIDARKEIK